MPQAVLAAIVFLIGVELVDILGMRRILAMRPREFWVALLTAAIVVVVGVEQAIIAAMASSLISHVRRGYSPQNSVLVPVATGQAACTPPRSRQAARRRLASSSTASPTACTTRMRTGACRRRSI